jgi:hypothetical protein
MQVLPGGLFMYVSIYVRIYTCAHMQLTETLPLDFLIHMYLRMYVQIYSAHTDTLLLDFLVHMYVCMYTHTHICSSWRHTAA